MLGWMVPNFAARLWSEFRIDWMGCDPSSYLHRAVGREDKALFNSISSHQNVDYNIKDYDGSSILFRLLSKKDYTWAKEAISLGAKIAEDENGAVELFMSAAKTGDEEVISILVDTMRFDVDLKDSAGLTAVYHAVSNNQKSLLKLILTYGPDISISDSGLLTLVHRAAQNGSEDMIKILIKYSPESMRADLKDASGLTPLYYALNNNHCKTAELLESHGAELHFVHEAEKELLNKATANGWLDAVLFLCQRGADVNHVGKNGMPPMLEALKAKHFEIVGALKSHGASHNVKDDQGNTSAHYAVKSSEMLEQIVKEGATFDQPNNAGKTPLFVAVANANSGHKDAPELIKSAKFLFSKGCKIDFAKPENAALLADNKGKEMFELLMKNGGKEGLNIMDAANKNSLHKKANDCKSSHFRGL